MAMARATKEAFDSMREVFAGREFSINEVRGISHSTFFKYYKEVGIECIHREEVEWYSLEEMVEFVNGLAGQDCYGASWNFSIRDGKVCEVTDIYSYRFL